MRVFGDRYVVESPNNSVLMKLFHKKCEENGIVHNNDHIFNYLNTFEEKEENLQLSFWD